MEQNTTEFSTYVKYRQSIGKLVIEPSARLRIYRRRAFFRKLRLGLKYNVTNSIRLKAAGGFILRMFWVHPMKGCCQPVLWLPLPVPNRVRARRAKPQQQVAACQTRGWRQKLMLKR